MHRQFPDNTRKGGQEITGEMREAVSRTLTALKALMAEHERTKSYGGDMKCPCCDGGTLAWGKSRLNGHYQAECSTKGCVRFIQ